MCAKWYRLYVIVAVVAALYGCTDIGDRDNPTDPLARNYVASTNVPDEDEGDSIDDEIPDGEDVELPGEDDEETSSSSKGKSSSGEAESSSSAKSSSSEATSSAAIVVATPCKTKDADECEYGHLVDSRDGKVYKTIAIGSKVWMAENLAYEGTGVKGSRYYGDDYKWDGRYYTWTQAVDSIGEFSSNAKGCGYGNVCDMTSPVRGICPEGWALPDSVDWMDLFNSVGGLSVAGTALKSMEWNGKDSYGFSAEPSGMINLKSEIVNVGTQATIWSSRIRGKYNADYYIFSSDASVKPYNSYKSNALPVRCVKVSGSTTPSSGSTESRYSSIKCEETDFWCKNSWYVVMTPVYSAKEESGHWMMSDDHAGGGLSTIQWPYGVEDMKSEEFKAAIDSCEGLCGKFILDKDTLLYNPYVKVLFSAASIDDLNIVTDATSWGGLCVTYTSDMVFSMELGLSEEMNVAMSYGLPYVSLAKASTYTEKCFSWDSFKQPTWVMNGKIDGPGAAAQLATVEFKFEGQAGISGNFNIIRIRKYVDQ